MVRISANRLTMEDGRIDNGIFKDWGETLVGGATGTNTGSTYTIDISAGNVYNLILNANCAFTFSNPTGSGTECSFTVILHQDSTGGRTATWPTVVRWPGGIAPVPTAIPYAIDIFAFNTYDGGATWYGFPMAQRMQRPQTYIKFGYFGGGDTPTVTSRVDRLDYSNDTVTAIAKGPLSLARSSLGATGTSAFGYFGGGVASPGTVSIVDRLDYSNDTAAAVAKGSLSLARYLLSAVGSSSFGYFGGGSTSPGTVSTVDRIDYNNDTAAAVVKGPFPSTSVYYGAATGNSSFGYFSELGDPIDRIDYSNDTATATTRSTLPISQLEVGATGDSSFGYFGGGRNGTTTLYSFVNRIDYSNDTATAVTKGPLSAARYGLGAVGSSSFSYFGGGYATPAIRSTIDRIDYSNDSAIAVVKSLLSLARRQLGATNHSAM